MIHLEELERNINFYIKILLPFFSPFFCTVIQFNNNSTCLGARVIKTKLNMIMLKMKDPLPPSTPLKNNNRQTANGITDDFI